jgi:dihydrofolate reductase
MNNNSNNSNKRMRKLKLQVQMSIDGCIAGPNNEMDWLIRDIKNLKYIHRIAESVDTILIGRKMVDEFIPYWTDVMKKSDNPWNAFAKKMIEIPKVVFTKTQINRSEGIQNSQKETSKIKLPN